MLTGLLRKARGRLCLLLDWLTRPAPLARSERELRTLARDVRGLALYEIRECRGSIRMRRHLHCLNLPLERRDIRKSQVHRDALLAGLGQITTPCLRVEERGTVRWIAQADEIESFLLGRFRPELRSPEAA